MDYRQTVPADRTGQRIDEYAVLERIGGGANGEVYKAASTGSNLPNHLAALKIQHRDATRELRERFQFEQEILCELNHSSIVKLFRSGRTPDGCPYFAMEYVEGSSIDTYCSRRRLGVRRRLTLFLGVLDAVQHVNRIGVHRDLKPEHVLVTDDGNPKLIDFGMARWIGSRATGAMPATPTGSQPQTTEYASPEQRVGERLNAGSDVYALGLILFQLLTGESKDIPRGAAPRASSYITGDRHAKDDCGLKSGAALRRRLKGDVDAILARALDPNSFERYQSAADFAADVRNHLAFRPVEARRGGRVYRWARFLRRNLPWAVVFVALASGLCVSLHERQQAAVARQLAENRASLAEERGRSIAALASTLKAELLESDGQSHRAGAGFYARLSAVFEEVANADEEQRPMALRAATQLLEAANREFETSGDRDRAAATRERLGILKFKAGVVRGRRTPPVPALPAANAALARSYATLGRMLVLTGDPSGAAQAYRACVSIAEDLPRSGPSGPEDAQTLAECQAARGAVR
jgi:predicted Ser/Thr protein kinase